MAQFRLHRYNWWVETVGSHLAPKFFFGNTFYTIRNIAFANAFTRIKHVMPGLQNQWSRTDIRPEFPRMSSPAFFRKFERGLVDDNGMHRSMGIIIALREGEFSYGRNLHVDLLRFGDMGIHVDTLVVDVLGVLGTTLETMDLDRLMRTALTRIGGVMVGQGTLLSLQRMKGPDQREGSRRRYTLRKA
ncbi:hypothetical protein CC80DRAFT_506136 [Byssothecium circinans]|uniref:Uncharacterized protein n=1 Tax=Byssothecium circinans TaxID=147558 RepID=A0A6A5TTA8_9PLEO|nr:hypothetical protein CC80DRAFT_506136 [Byssothecium circinans]